MADFLRILFSQPESKTNESRQVYLTASSILKPYEHHHSFSGKPISYDPNDIMVMARKLPSVSIEPSSNKISQRVYSTTLGPPVQARPPNERAPRGREGRSVSEYAATTPIEHSDGDASDPSTSMICDGVTKSTTHITRVGVTQFESIRSGREAFQGQGSGCTDPGRTEEPAVNRAAGPSRCQTRRRPYRVRFGATGKKGSVLKAPVFVTVRSGL